MAVGALVLAASACGGSEPASSDAAFSIVATTSIHGDIVRGALGDLADGAVSVEVVIPAGADPHEFAPSAKQAETMENADLLVVNGLDLEEGLQGVIDAVADSGTPVFTFADHVPVLDEDEDEDHADADHADGDPHVWMDPTAMRDVVEALGVQLADAGIEVDVSPYVEALEQLDADLAATLAVIDDDDRVMVTNHDSFGYFADRYGLEIVGAVIPSLTTSADPSPADLDALADVMRERGVQAIFAENVESDRLATALADEVGGDVRVVELFSGSLGDEGSGAETYVELMRSNADIIAEVLAS